MKEKILKTAKEFIDFIDNSKSVFHVVKNCEEILIKNGFEKLNNKNKWELKKGKKYYVKRSDSAIVAFSIGKELDLGRGFKIFASHTDSPGFRIKPNPEVVTNGILRLNTEVYGGPILNTWFDRPLSIAGKVLLKSNEVFNPRVELFKIDKPILTIPNLAIHQNREVNNGVKIDRQKDTLPMLSLVNDNLERNDFLINIIAKHLEVDKSEILDFDLFIYTTEKGELVGLNEEFISAPKIDNLASVFAGLKGIINSCDKNNQINVFIGFDNEEIGSATKQGADSNYLSNVLERITYSLGYTRYDYLNMLYSSFILSADGAHAAHPAFLNKSDITNLGKLNEGIQIKISANQRYTSDAHSIAVIKQIIEGKDIKIQYFVNNSNEVGGSTIGPISSTHLDIDSVDLGVPMLAMHSVRELCGINDIYYLKELAKEFFLKK